MAGLTDRRDLLVGLGAFAATFGSQIGSGRAQTVRDSTDLILFNGKITTLDRQNPNATAVAIADGRFVAVGSDSDILQRAATNVRRVDLNGRRVIPGLIDSHLHIIRGGLNYNMELRWDGVRSLADAMADAQAAGCPHARSAMGARRRRLHRAPVRGEAAADIGRGQRGRPRHAGISCCISMTVRCSTAPRCGPWATPRIRPTSRRRDRARRRGGEPTGLLMAKPNAAILYATLAKGPKLPPEYQKNSTRHFMREVNRLA